MAGSGQQDAGQIAVFVRRPILAFVLNALTVMAGLAALYGVEVRELPDVDRPVITVRTNFPGAAPETVDREVTAVIEGAIGRVSGVKAISSESEYGDSRVTVEFGDSSDLDVAASDARDAIGRIVNALPEGAEEPRIIKADANADPVLRIGVTSAARSVQELTELVQDEVENRLVSVSGVADLQIYGDRERVFRVDVDLAALASRGLTLGDLSERLADAAFDVPAGALTSPDQSILVRTTAAISTPEQFEAVLLAPYTRIGDVATVTLGPDPGDSALRANGQTGIGLGVIRQAQSNTLEISSAVRAEVEALQRILPEDVRIFVTSDEATFVKGAIREVLRTLALAVSIVVAIIFLFLRDWRATLIPGLTIPVALTGSLAAIWLVGFSVNILTLLALVLATGMVVDDAIVVLENIVRRRGQGLGPRAAAVIGTEEVFFAVVTTTATLAAVFVPISFLPGQSGGLFREFGFTLAIAVVLSSVVALTLCPVMASRMLRGADAGRPRHGPLARLGVWLAERYRRTLHWALGAPLVVLTVAALFAATASLVFGDLRRELTPTEDRAVALMSVSAPQGVSLDHTQAKMREIESLLLPMRQRGEIEHIFLIAGAGGDDNRGFIVVTLAPWEERERTQDEIVTEINGHLSEVVGVQAYAIQPNSLGIRGAGRGLQFALVGSDYAALSAMAERLIAEMEREPRFGRVQLDYERTQPQLFIEVDRERASDLGIEIKGLGEALRAVLDGRTVGEVFIDDKSYEVKLVSTANPVNDPEDLENIFVESGSGAMLPISTVVRLEERAIAPELAREDQQRAVSVTASLTPDFALGDALDRVEELAEPILDERTGIMPLAEAATLGETSAGLLVTFGFAILVVFLVLSAQFESFVSAIIVMATVPLGLACAVFALLLTGMTLNVYSQIGLVLLVGIMAKNGILIVEFANRLRDRGESVRDAIEHASSIRLRPVMMTMTSTVLGGVPLVLSVGAGAEAREALGWVIVGGLGLATLSTLYLTPVAYLLLARFSTPRAAEERRLVDELRAAAAPPAE
jgi:hydrophobic/amphiphilic exporter-1 (mainly G- bacteria), HAE1 family